MYYVYLIRCAGGSLYAGVAADWQRRMREHMSRGKRCARYTRAHPVESLAALWTAPDKGAALRLEYRLKRLAGEEKRLLAASPAAWRERLPSLAGEDYAVVEGAALPASETGEKRREE